MAELSERDMQVILGQARQKDDRVEQIAQEVNSPAKKLASCESQKMSSVFLVLTAMALLIGNFILIGPTIGIEKALSGSLLVFGVAWYIYLGFTMKRLRSSLAHAG